MYFLKQLKFFTSNLKLVTGHKFPKLLLGNGHVQFGFSDLSKHSQARVNLIATQKLLLLNISKIVFMIESILV